VSGQRRATFEPDSGRRGKLWVHGAFEPATGEATLVFSERRDSASHIQLLEQIVQSFPAERWLLIEDPLSTHSSRDVKTALLSWPEIQIQFLPKYASWMNLIDPWWKQLKSLALKGRRFENSEELQQALEAALVYWNEHRRPFLLIYVVRPPDPRRSALRPRVRHRLPRAGDDANKVRLANYASAGAAIRDLRERFADR